MKNFIIQNKLARSAMVAVFWIAIWQICAVLVNRELLIPLPFTVFECLISLVWKKYFWITTFYSLIRVLIGFSVAAICGTLLAVATSRFITLRMLFYPAIAVIRATPIVSIVILSLVFLKTHIVPIFMSFLIVLPIFWSNISEGIHKTDCALIEMSKLFRFGRFKTLKLIYIPSVSPFFMAAFTTGLGIAWKASIAAEVLGGGAHSIGKELRNAKTYLETPEVFAWTFVVIILSIFFENVLTKLINTIYRKYGGYKIEKQFIV